MRELDSFKACYCALCHALKDRYGAAARYILNYDFLFLAMLLWPEGEIVCLVKPQFEAGRSRVGKKGVVRDKSVHRDILEELFLFFPTLGLYPAGLSWSPIRGPEGNIEYLCHLRRQPAGSPPDPRTVVEEAHNALK